MDGSRPMYLDNRIAETIVLPPGSSFAEVPFLLRVDLTDPAVQAEIKRQMAIPENEDGKQILAEIQAATAELLQGL